MHKWKKFFSYHSGSDYIYDNFTLSYVLCGGRGYGRFPMAPS